MRHTHSSSEFVRQNPAPFVGPTGTPDLRSLAGDLAVDAIVLGAQSVTIEIFKEWFVVVANDNWLTRNTNLSLVECFHRIQPLSELRANSNRTPVVITAFAENVLVLVPEGQTIIKGCNKDTSALTNHLHARFPGQCAVAFSVLVPPALPAGATVE
jgi:hypothetical protein